MLDVLYGVRRILQVGLVAVELVLNPPPEQRTRCLTQRMWHGGVVRMWTACEGAWRWPLRGVATCLRDPRLLRPLARPLALAAATSVVGTALWLLLAFLPHLALLSLSLGPLLGAAAALAACVSEAHVGVALVTRGVWLRGAHDRLFDHVLRTTRSCHDARTTSTSSSSSTSLTFASDSAPGSADALASSQWQPWSATAAVAGVAEEALLWVATLPLHVVPVVGTLLFLLAHGHVAGKAAHQRYFQSKRWDARQRAQRLRDHRTAYDTFGVVAVALQLLPGVGVPLTLTNAVGAALWAAELDARTAAAGVDADREQQKRVSSSSDEGALRHRTPLEGVSQ